MGSRHTFPIKFRLAREKDYLHIAALLEKTKLIGHHFNKRLFNTLIRKNRGFLFVAGIDKKIIGTIFSAHDGGYFGYVYKCAVAPEFRRQKVATQLVRLAINKLKKAGIDLIFLHVKKDNFPSIRLFQSLGFNIRATRYLMDNQK